MIISRLSTFAVALAALAAIACASEDAAEPAAPPQVAASQPATAPTPTALPQVTPTQPPAPTPAPEPEERDLDRDLDIVTLLPFDAIPAVLDPVFISAEDANAELTKRGEDPDNALVLGLSINGDSRAYYVPSLSSVEIINDTVGGQPLAVTW